MFDYTEGDRKRVLRALKDDILALLG